MSLPQVLIASTKEGKAREIAENIGAKRLSEQDDIVDYLWNIDNKYYTSQVLVRVVDNVSFTFPVEGVSALIVYHDPQADKVDQELEHLAASLSTLFSTAEVFLYACDSISDTYVRDKVLNWCIHNKFEMVELEQTGDSEFDTEDNKYGIERIIEALHAHTWPNIVLKDKLQEEAPEVNEIGEQFENMRLTRDPSERLCMEDMLNGIMGDQNADFGELFGQLMVMKEHAASLPTNERRIVAEQVVTAFWKAMGGDLLEIED